MYCEFKLQSQVFAEGGYSAINEGVDTSCLFRLSLDASNFGNLTNIKKRKSIFPGTFNFLIVFQGKSEILLII